MGFICSKKTKNTAISFRGRKKEFKKERENLKFDISKFNVTKKQDCLSSDIKYLQQSLGCDAQVGTVEKGRAGLKNLKPKISDMQKKISSNEKKIDGDFNQLDLAKDCIERMQSFSGYKNNDDESDLRVALNDLPKDFLLDLLTKRPRIASQLSYLIAK